MVENESATQQLNPVCRQAGNQQSTLFNLPFERNRVPRCAYHLQAGTPIIKNAELELLHIRAIFWLYSYFPPAFFGLGNIVRKISGCKFNSPFGGVYRRACGPAEIWKISDQ